MPPYCSIVRLMKRQLALKRIPPGNDRCCPSRNDATSALPFCTSIYWCHLEFWICKLEPFLTRGFCWRRACLPNATSPIYSIQHNVKPSRRRASLSPLTPFLHSVMAICLLYFNYFIKLTYYTIELRCTSSPLPPFVLNTVVAIKKWSHHKQRGDPRKNHPVITSIFGLCELKVMVVLPEGKSRLGPGIKLCNGPKNF